MVKRSISLGRRLRAWRGAIFSFLVWIAAAGTAGVIYLQDSMTGDTLAVARTELAPVRVPESSRVARIAVKLGQRVEAGEVLAVMEVPGLQQQIAAAVSELESAKGNLNIQNSDRGRRFQMDIAGARAKYLAATVSLREQESRLSELNLEYTRVTAPGVALPAAQVEAIGARRSAAEALVEAQKREVDELKSSLDQAISRAGSMMDPQVQAQLDALSLNLESLKARQEQATLRATIAGIVGGALPPPGTWMPAGTELMSVSAASTREAVAWLPAESLRTVKVGSSVSLEGSEGNLAATVESIGGGVQAVPGQALTDPSRPEWKVPVLLQAERDLLPGEVLVAGF